jgi:hypothetical protein
MESDKESFYKLVGSQASQVEFDYYLIDVKKQVIQRHRGGHLS